jgi:hypothetical protein
MSTSLNIIEKIKNDLRFIVLEPNLCLYSHEFKPNNYYTNLKKDLDKALAKIPDASLNEILGAYAHHYRLGIYAEKLLGLYFLHSDRFDLIEKNIQLIIDKRTIGEIDFIVFDYDENRLKHIELGCKFYIQMGKEINDWVGPNPKDNLEKKSKKLLKQLDLSTRSHSVFEDIKNRYGSDFQREAWIKGRLFGNTNDLPQQSKHISCGRVFKTAEIDDVWEPLKKIDWISGVKEIYTNNLAKWDDAQMLLEKNGWERAFYLSEKWLSDYQHSIF